MKKVKKKLFLLFLIIFIYEVVAWADDIYFYDDAVIQSGDSYPYPDRVFVYDTPPGNTVITMTGGTIDSMYMYDASILNLSGGHITWLRAYDSSTIEMNEGYVGRLIALNSSTFHLRGGESGLLIADNSSNVFNIYGYKLEYDPSGGALNEGMLTGYWADYTPFTLNMHNHYDTVYPNHIVLHVIPEPTHDWYIYPMNGHQYALTQTHSNWTDAEAEAVFVDGHLVTVNDEAELNWLLDTNSHPFGSQYARAFNGISDWNIIWIGLEYIAGDKTLPSSWAWTSGEPVTFWNPSPSFTYYYNGIHMHQTGPFHHTPGEWNCQIDQDIIPSRHLRGVIEYVPQFLIKTPNGGENLPRYSTYSITWETYSKIPVDDVLLEYSRDNGQAWESIGVVENTGSYEWEVPDANSDQCLVRVSNSQYPVINDTSDSVFTIFECKKVLIGDLNKDCYINFYDIALIALGWLDCGNPFDPACGL